MEQRSFLGRGLKFPLQVDGRTGKFAMVSEEEDIRESIGIILNTMRGERVMRPEFGTNTMEYLFAPASSTLRYSLTREIEEQLLFQEPRITAVEAVCRPDGQGKITMEVSYTIRSTNSRYNHVFPFYLTEGSEGGGGA